MASQPPLQFKAIPADMAINLYEGLVAARRLKLHPALSKAVVEVGTQLIDADLHRLVPAAALTQLAGLGLRGERVFPVPALIRHAPPLIGYYRMLLGISQKEFQQANRLGYSPWVNAEESGRLSARLDAALDDFCQALIAPLVQLVATMGTFEDRDLNDLALLTLGPTLQGGRNNVIGSRAAEGVLQSLRVLLGQWSTYDDGRIMRCTTPTGRSIQVTAGSDPDIRIDEGAGTQLRPLVAIEIKGGSDASNAHNRAGEAEKSHIKAALAGYGERWTVIVMQGVDPQQIRKQTPSSTQVFEARDVLQQDGPDWKDFGDKLRELLH